MIFWARTALVRKLSVLKRSLKKENRCGSPIELTTIMQQKNNGSWELQFEEYHHSAILSYKIVI
jgi:hypothetical protein